jgi:hypothetical protein
MPSTARASAAVLACCTPAMTPLKVSGVKVITMPADPRIKLVGDCSIVREPEGIYVWDVAHNRHFTIPFEHECDGASIPALAGFFLQKHHYPPIAAQVHDFLTRTPGHLGYQRIEADRLFIWLIERENEDSDAARVEQWRIDAAYRGVRLGGWRSWKRGDR